MGGSRQAGKGSRKTLRMAVTIPLLWAHSVQAQVAATGNTEIVVILKKAQQNYFISLLTSSILVEIWKSIKLFFMEF